jgi:large subunit ribosomal protein L10
VERVQKKVVVSELKDQLIASHSVVLMHYQGLTVDEITKLRRKMRGQGASFKVTKNSLARLAVAGTNFDKLTSLLNGPTAIAFSDDPIAAARSAVQFSNENDKLVILGGMVDDQVLDAKGVKALATMPSLDELRAKIIGILSTPATRVAGVLQAPAGQLARLFSAYAKKGQ